MGIGESEEEEEIGLEENVQIRGCCSRRLVL